MCVSGIHLNTKQHFRKPVQYMLKDYMEGPGNVTINNVAFPTNLGGITLSLSMRRFWIVYALPYTVNIGRALETVISAFCIAALLL